MAQKPGPSGGTTASDQLGALGEELMGKSWSQEGDTAIGRAFAEGREEKGEIAWPLLSACPLIFCQFPISQTYLEGNW